MSTPQTTLPKGSWILITGANGFVASHTAKQFLERGYKVRGTVRDLSKSSWLTEDIFKGYADSGDFEMVQVADLAVEHAFDDAVRGMSAIVHVASIGTFDPNPHKSIPQVILGVTSLLESSLKEPSVKEFVYTSSIAATAMPIPGNITHIGPDTWNETAVQLAWAPPPYDDPARPFITYMAGKAEGEKALWKFVADKKPHFAVNSIYPGAILGESLNKKHCETPYAWVKVIYDGKREALAGTAAS
jgi:nucleoside-diphosphate-sugar epimerase